MKKLLVEHVSLVGMERSEINESVSKNDGKLILRNVLLQRADAPNKNRRIYPRAILERELNNYFKKIDENRAFGELDHPYSCFHDKTEILTRDGWKLFANVLIGEEVATLNTDSEELEWQPVNKVTNDNYTGKMIKITGNNIDTLVTPNHRFYVKNRYGKFEIITAQELHDVQFEKDSTHTYIPITMNWTGKEYETWKIDAVFDYNGTNNNKEKQSNDLLLNGDAFFAFLGFYLAEGGCSKNSNEIIISQKEGKRSQLFREVLSKLSPEINHKEYKDDKNTIRFSIIDCRLSTYLKRFGNIYTKSIPDDVKDASPRLLQILFDWFLMGDGASIDYKGYNRKSVFTVSKKLIEDLHEILLKTGQSGVIKVQNNHLNDRFIEGRIIEGKNCQPLYRLWVKKSKGIHIDFRFLNVSEVDYSGTVHCVSVDNGTIYCRDGIAPFWSGNSDEGNVVSLKNVCQVIRDAYWNGNEVRGDVEILKTPSGNIIKELLLAGCRVGQSSRGLGSVEPLREGDDDIVEVQDDFEILALADCVSDESTHNANMRLGESVLRENSKSKKQTKIDLLVRDLICEMSGICEIC